jgi:hypothetical protein
MDLQTQVQKKKYSVAPETISVHDEYKEGRRGYSRAHAYTIARMT